MIISKCPLRISLIGGSTDSPDFLSKYKFGEVISFPTNLYTYSFIHRDCNGFNNHDKKYIISYSKLEKCDSIGEIKNELIRECLNYFDSPPIKVSLEADIFSEGSGLASSSSFILNLVNCFNKFFKSNLDVIKTSFEIESKINPKNGYQDTYGCALPNFKKISFDDYGSKVTVKNLPNSLFKKFDCFLLYTNIKRNSSSILSNYNIDKSVEFLELTKKAYKHILNENYFKLFDLINESWKIKKQISNDICGDQYLLSIDDTLYNCKDVLCHKMCGAGGGGYFLVFSRKNKLDLSKIFSNPFIKINLDINGLRFI